MLLSKTNDPTPRAEDTRPIVILNTELKVIQAVLLYLTEELLWRHIDNNQLGFRKGASTELQLARTMR